MGVDVDLLICRFCRWYSLVPDWLLLGLHSQALEGEILD